MTKKKGGWKKKTMSADEDVGLPKATVMKLIKEQIGETQLRCSDATRDTIAACALEFVKLLSSTANEHAESHGKKIIGISHMIEALEQLGFESYADDVRAAAAEHAGNREKLPSKRLKQPVDSATQAELARQQQQLFDQARLRMEAEEAAAAASATASISSAGATPAVIVTFTEPEKK